MQQATCDQLDVNATPRSNCLKEKQRPFLFKFATIALVPRISQVQTDIF